MRTEIISVGNELLAGLVVNSNAVFIGEKLAQLGYEIRWITTIGDDEADLTKAIQTAYDRASLVIITGGLGPTHDDITKRVVSKFFNSELVFCPEILKKIETFFEKRGRRMAPINRVQAEIPDKAEIIENEIGTAPGFIFTRDKRSFFLLPGVSEEMKMMMEKKVIPRILRKINRPVVETKILRTIGISESELYQQIKNFPDRFSDIKLAFLPNSSGVAIRLVVSGHSTELCNKKIIRGEKFIRNKVGQKIYGEGDESIENAVANLLFKKKKTIAVAESCTGGLICHKLTNVSGSSIYFNRGIIAYSNEAKVNILGVPEEIIIKHGAVSSETASVMAQGVRRISGTDMGISTTGIAGPSGGTAEKPIGLIYIGFADNERSFTEKYLFTRGRLWNKERSAVTALDLVRRVLLGYV